MVAETCTLGKENKDSIRGLYKILHNKDGYGERIKEVETKQEFMADAVKEVKDSVKGSVTLWGIIIAVCNLAGFASVVVVIKT